MKEKEVKKIVKTASHPLLVVEVILGVFGSIGSMLLFLYVVQNTLRAQFVEFDAVVALFITSFRTPLLNQIMMFVTALGNELVLIASAVFIIGAVIKRHIREAILFGYIVATGALLNLLLKALIDRPRPEQALIQETFASLPSGHAMNSLVFYATLSYFTYHFTKSKKISAGVLIVSIVLILLIGISRIYLGVHYPTDILAGYIAGFWWFCTSLLMHKTIQYLRSSRSKQLKA
jgi:undecaprenyl-diphosphatase